MAICGPRITTSDLTLYLDNQNINSYLGEPSVNLTDTGYNIENNSRFGPGNNWGTYNTSQYWGDGNTAGGYWTLGITGVSGNVISYNSYGGYTAFGDISTYDVIHPQTTGGGVTAGTKYLVKRLDSGIPGTFTLHAWSSDQTGSFGYINPDTGQHKIHDSMWLNGGTPVSVSASGFPTMWHGPAHTANAHCVKELRDDGGGPQGQRYMRIHNSGFKSGYDGMAYGVMLRDPDMAYTYSISFWHRGTITPNQFVLSHHHGGASVPWNAFNPTSEWQRVEFQWQPVNNNYPYLISYFFPYNATDGIRRHIDICDYKIEQNVHATSWNWIERSTTDGWKDLTSNENHANFDAVTFSSTNIPGTIRNTFSFDGTDDYMDIGTLPSESVKTVAAWIKADVNHGGVVFCPQSNGHDNWFGVESRLINILATESADVNNFWVNGTTYMDNGGWYYIAMTIDYSAKTVKCYLNGILENSVTRTHTIGDWGGADTTIGRRGVISQRYFNGEIVKLAIYDRVLTEAELKQNYESHKYRYV